MNKTKNLKAASGKVDRKKKYALTEAVKVLQEIKFAKFDESVDLSFRIGVDPKRADQMVRSVISLPHGTGKKVRVLAFAVGEKDTEAREAGADIVGGEDLIAKIQGGWMDFDIAVATPDLMRVVGKLGKQLGARGLMPNPKSGTVTQDIGKTVRELKAGRIEFRVDRQGNVAARVGKMSFPSQHLEENIIALTEALVKAKPSTAKGQYLLSATVSSTMGPGIRLDQSTLHTEKAQ